MNDPNTFNPLSAKQLQSMIGSRPLPLAGFLWFLTSACLLGQSTIQFIGRGFTVDESVGQVVLPVERLNDLETEVVVEFSTVEDTATAGQDFTPVSGTLSFGAGVTQQTIPVPILNDGLVESTERFQVILTNATGGAVLGARKVLGISIQDNDAGVRFAAESTQTVEDIGEIRLVVYRGNDGDQPVTVDYATIDGTALAGTDYEASSGTLTFGPDDTFQEITVAILNDGVIDPDKSFQVQLSQATGGALGTPSLATVTIQDPTPVILTQPFPGRQSVSLGAVIKLRASAKGARMQWQQRVGEGEFTDVAGATGQVLEFNDVTVEQAGEYRLVVSSNTGESVTSQVAMVEVDPTFTKITEGPIVSDREPSQSGVWCDYDGNGLLDLFVANGSPPAANSLYRQEQDGSFARVRIAATELPGDSYAGLWADYDNDGYTDLLVTGGTVEIFRNDGHGQLLSANLPLAIPSWALNGAWADVDGDGWLDLFLTDFIGGGAGDCLLLNRGDGDFRRLTAAETGSVISDGVMTITVAFCDYDNNGDPDLFVGSRGVASWLYQNLGAGKFEKVRAGSLPAAQSETGIWADFNNDGYFDLFTITPVGVLHLNLAGQGFEDVTQAAFGRPINLTAFGPAWGDYDNDGDLDLFIPNYFGPNHMFRNNGDGTFTSIDVASPLQEGTTDECASWIDYDNDGFLDLFVACGETTPALNLLYRNALAAAGNSNHWLKVQLSGRASNQSGIGARLHVQATIAGQPVGQVRQIASNGVFGNGPELLAHFGLGDATKVDTLRIEWPSGIVQELTDVAVNQQLQVVETQGLNLPEPLSVQTSALDAEGVFHATVNCPVDGAVCVLESSSDLERWAKVKVGTVSGGTVELTDAHASQSPTRFYRVLVP